MCHPWVMAIAVFLAFCHRACKARLGLIRSANAACATGSATYATWPGGNTIIEGLARHLQDVAAARRQFIQEENAVVRERPPGPAPPSPLDSLFYLGGCHNRQPCRSADGMARVVLVPRQPCRDRPASLSASGNTPLVPRPAAAGHSSATQSGSVSRRRGWRGAARDPARPDGALRESPARYPPRRIR